MLRCLFVVLATYLLIVGAAVGGADRETPGKRAMGKSSPEIQVHPIGRVTRQNDRSVIEIRPELAAALEGLEGFSHVWVLYWFHENDRPEERAILKVHPRRDPTNPLTGVFATRSPMRPNLIALTCCRIVSVKKNILEVEGLDAREGSPVLDLKPYIPYSDALPEAKVPWWVNKIRKKKE
jgi:tRNA-Thr(GGU) m(6)t(6)A37 methyltransferase TsaA